MDGNKRRQAIIDILKNKSTKFDLKNKIVLYSTTNTLPITHCFLFIWINK